MTSFAVIAVDSSLIGNRTRFRITFQPTHSMKTASALEVKFPPTLALDQGSCTLSNFTKVTSNGSNCTVTNNVLFVRYPFGASSSYTSGSGVISFVFSAYANNPEIGIDAGAFTITTFELDASNNTY